MSFNIENESIVCQLYHRSKHNHSVNVVCELSDKIGSPFIAENDQWVVPSDVIGLGAKKPKNIKIMFHPSVAEFESEDLRKTACQSALKYLDLLLEESEWTRRDNQEDHLLSKQIEKMMQIVGEMDKTIEFDTRHLNFSFLANEDFEELLRIAGCKSLTSHLGTRIVENADCQHAELVFRKSGQFRTLIRLVLDPGYLKSTKDDVEAVFEASKTCFSWILNRYEDDADHSPPNVTQRLDCYFLSDGSEQEMPVYSPCASVFHHLDKLSTSLLNPPTTNETLQKVTQALAVDAIIGLDKNNAPHLQKFIQNITQTPLTIHTDFETPQSDSFADNDNKLTISPTDSVDSGVSLNSPTRQSSFDDDLSEYEDTRTSPVPRERSRSESCSLKGILKWPRRQMTSASRIQSKLMRSYSECYHDDDKLPVMMPLRFSEDDEDAFHEEDYSSSSDCCVLPAVPRKKSVSFSEKIEQTRLFNSNSSINAQKRKNQKKNDKKKKRENSLASSIESIHEELQSGGRVSPSSRNQTV